MKKRWIALGMFAAAGIGVYLLGLRNVAEYNRTSKYDGEFVVREGPGQWPEVRYYKYGTKIALCLAEFCRVGTTRKDSEALLERKSNEQGVYCYEMEYVNGFDKIPPNIKAWIFEGYHEGRKSYQTPEEFLHGYFDRNICLTVGPAATWLELPPGGGGSIMRTPGSESGPPKWVADQFVAAGLK
jgi:hypothetical protein